VIKWENVLGKKLMAGGNVWQSNVFIGKKAEFVSLGRLVYLVTTMIVAGMHKHCLVFMSVKQWIFILMRMENVLVLKINNK